jgi:hypothetical protein
MSDFEKIEIVKNVLRYWLYRRKHDQLKTCEYCGRKFFRREYENFCEEWCKEEYITEVHSSDHGIIF